MNVCRLSAEAATLNHQLLGLRSGLALLAVPLLVACSSGWKDEYKKGADASRKNHFEQAERHFQNAVRLAAEQKQPAGAAESLIAYARVEVEQGQYHQARPAFEQAIVDFEKLYGRQSRQVSAALVELAACLYNQQEYRQAEPLCEEALRIERGLAKPSPIVMATALNNLAEIAKQRGDDTRAETFYMEAIDIHKKNPDKRSLRMAVQTFNNLAMLYKADGRFPLAHKAADEAQALQKSVGPGDVVAAASILNARASIARAHFDSATAEESYKQAIRLLGKAHEEPLCDTLDNYADLLLDQRDQENAERYYLEAIVHCTRARGAEHPCVAERKVDLGTLYRRLGKYELAEKHLKEALAINTKAFDFESPIVINTINDLSAVYVDQKKFAEAGDLYARWIPELTRDLGPSHPHVADALENWALVASKSNNAAQAEQLRERARSIRAALTRPSQPRGSEITDEQLTLHQRKSDD